MPYTPNQSKYLTVAQVRTNNGQKDVKIILDIDTNIFYTLDDDNNFIPIAYSQNSGIFVDIEVTNIADINNLYANVITGSTVSATNFIGDGSLLTNIPTPSVYAQNTQSFLQSKFTQTTTIAAGVNFLRGYYITIDKSISFNQLWISISATSAGNSINGIYSILSNGYPDVVLYTTTVFDNGVLNQQISSQTGTLIAGTYFVAQNSSSAATFRALGVNSLPNTANFFGVTDGANINTGLTVAFNYTGSLPATFPVGATVTTGVLPYLLFNIV